MTLPVIPGPFSGLQQAGQVIGESLAKKRAMSIEDEARARAALLTLGQLGILRSDAMAAPEFASTFQAANVPQPSAGAVKPDVEAEKGNRLMKLLANNDENSFLGRMLVGAPTEAMENEDALKAYVAKFVADEINKSPAVARAVTKTPEAGLAEKAEQVQSGALDAEALNNQMRVKIRQNVIKRLPKDAQFSRLADYAEIGALGVLVSEIQARHGNLTMAKQEALERMKGVMQINDQASREFRERYNKWFTERNNISDPNKLALLNQRYQAADDEDKPKVQQEILDLYDEQNPEPDQEAILEEHLRVKGVSLDQFHAMERDLLNLSKEADAQPAQGGSSSSAPPAMDNMVAITVQNIVDGKATLDDLAGSTKLTKQQKDEVRRLVAARSKK